jgi:hypothetical protein
MERVGQDLEQRRRPPELLGLTRDLGEISGLQIVRGLLLFLCARRRQKKGKVEERQEKI